MKKWIPAMQRLLLEGFFETKEEATPYFLSGSIYCDGKPISNGGVKISTTLPLYVKGLNERYVSKGGYKLEGALHDFSLSVDKRVCIDAGACTGGFTDCLIKHGAEKVYAVEVGYGQLAGSLMQNDKVINLEKTNIGDEQLLQLEPSPTFASVDLSYLSLVKAIPIFRSIMKSKGDICCLVKPLFEIDDSQARRDGVLASHKYGPLLEQLIETLNQQENTSVQQVTNSPVTGNGGTIEFFLHVHFGNEVATPNLQDSIQSSVNKALSLPTYKK